MEIHTSFGIGDCRGTMMSNSCPSDCSQRWSFSLEGCYKHKLTDNKEHYDHLGLPRAQTPESNRSMLSHIVFPSCVALAARVPTRLFYQPQANSLVVGLTFVVSIDTGSVIDHRGIGVDIC